MADFNLVSRACDRRRRTPIGVVAVDDIIELTAAGTLAAARGLAR